MAMQMLDLVTVDPSVLHRQAFIHTPRRAGRGQGITGDAPINVKSFEGAPG